MTKLENVGAVHTHTHTHTQVILQNKTKAKKPLLIMSKIGAD